MCIPVQRVLTPNSLNTATWPVALQAGHTRCLSSTCVWHYLQLFSLASTDQPHWLHCTCVASEFAVWHHLAIQRLAYFLPQHVWFLAKKRPVDSCIDTIAAFYCGFNVCMRIRHRHEKNTHNRLRAFFSLCTLFFFSATLPRIPTPALWLFQWGEGKSRHHIH